MTMLMAAACLGGFQEEGRVKAIKEVFDAMEKAVRAGDEAAFKGGSSPEGYAKNLVGPSGLAGREVFAQGARKRRFLKPDTTRLRVLGEGAAVVVPCEAWAREKGRAVDKVGILPVRDGERPVVLGGGEQTPEVEALADRFLKKQPPAPPAEQT